MDVLLLRHGETALNRSGALRGHLDVPLTAHGRTEVNLLGQRVAREWKVTAIHTSPLQRARDTAAAVAAVTGAGVDIRRGWIDIDYGRWAGCPPADFDDGDFEAFIKWRQDPSIPLPGGENPATVRQRAMAELHRLSGGGESVAVVTHDAVIQIVLCTLLGLPLPTYRGLIQSTAALNLLRWDGAAWSVQLVNSAWHLDTRLGTESRLAVRRGNQSRDTARQRRVIMVSAGGVVVNDAGSVLVLHSESGKLLLPKGKLERDEDPRDAALREVQEETGVAAELVRRLGATSYSFVEDGCSIEKSVHWYLMRAAGEQPRQSMGEAGTAEWLSPDEAMGRLRWSEQRQVLAWALAEHDPTRD
ncbi:MAG: histidine phosphatase family protein [Candidatus Dormibacteria bacterium]